MRYVLMEAARKKKYDQKYKCPYCDLKFIRKDLAPHIDKKHQDLIPEGYTALRVAFNTVYKKTEGHCIICQQVTAWNEQKGRYERLCGRAECKEEYIRITKERIKRVTGSDCILKDKKYAEEQQRKMLDAKSKTYTFSDGGKIKYIGSYELKTLRFLDNIMHIESSDLLPGPVIYYNYNNDTHMYFSDFFYTPYNLIIEVKDGGDNPDKHRSEEYRAKQIAKERAIIDDGKYNYIRLTNNEFSQLMEIFAAIKYSLVEDPDQIVVRINEDSSSAIASALAPTNQSGGKYYMVQHLMNNSFAYGITKDPTQGEMITVDPETRKVVAVFKKDLDEYHTYEMKHTDRAEEVYKTALHSLKEQEVVDNPAHFYEMYGNKNLLVDTQIAFDDGFVLISNFDDEIKSITEQVYEDIYGTAGDESVAILKEACDKLSSLIYGGGCQ